MNPLLAALISAGVLPQADAERIDRTLSIEAARQYAEQTLIGAFRNGLSGQQRRLLGLTNDTQGEPTARQLSLFWEAEDGLLWSSIDDDIRSVALERAVSVSVGLGDASTWELVNEQVIGWVDAYYISADAENFGSIPNLNATSKTIVGQAINAWQRGELRTEGYDRGLPTLIRALEPAFGASRAERIAITETTRVFSESELAAGRANPFIVGWIYNTANDSLVSDLCRPAQSTVMLKGQTRFPDGLGPPPRHVRCRSGITALTQPALDALRERGFVQPGRGPLPVMGTTEDDGATVAAAPEPVVPSFSTVDEAQQWATRNLIFGQSAVRYDGLEVETVNAINARLAERLPEVAHLSKFEDGKLRAILTQKTRGTWHMAMNQDTAILGINTKYNTLDKWGEMWDADIDYQARFGIPFSSKKYFAREDAIKITLDHEIGHSVQWSLNAEQKKAWAKATRDARRSGWQRPTGYAAHDKQEEFAEYFALYVNGRRDLMTPDMATFFDDVLRKP